MADYIRRTATNLGINPSDLATAISYETGGKFDQNLWGGKGGNYLGLIQFGPEEQTKYGVKPGMPLDAHFGAVENFLRDRGVKPGMGMLDLYSTINAGSPGLYNRSDAANGGMPGTVAEKVAEQMAGHRIRANGLLGTNDPIGITPAVQNAGVAAQPAVAGVAPGEAAPAATAPADQAAQAGSFDVEKLIKAVGGMGGQQKQEDQLQPVQIATPMPAGLPSAQRLAAIMQSLGRPS
jgi:hypothetical protein